MSYLFTSESVSEGHPDKVADQISDALLDEFLKLDPESKVACETLVTTGLVVCSGEVKTSGWVDPQEVVRRVVNQIGYNKASYRFDGNTCGIISTIHEQSDNINKGVVKQVAEEQGAGDQGMMFGYAVREMDNLMPISIELAHIILQQERLTTEIKDCIHKTLKPLGVAVVIEAQHMCMSMRGIQKQNSVTTTSDFTGAFANEKTRAEFIHLIGSKLH
jgi:S-adenosylmethionine synthetase